MQEYVTEAIIIGKEPLRDLDGRYSVFTKRFGKIIGKTTSSRKITSKLSAHLEPGTMSRVRFIERNGTQIVDALKISRLPFALPDLHLLNTILPEAMPDLELWDMFSTGRFTWRDTLRILGWDPNGADCGICHRLEVAAFHIPRQEFLCLTCASKVRKSEVILM